MELIINDVQMPESIPFNFEELKAELTEQIEQYKSLVYTEEQIALAKADLAKLRKLLKALEDARIMKKKECLKPYEEFEARIKELTAILGGGISNIDTQVKGFEAAEKEAKRAAIEEHFAMIGHPEWLSLEQIFDDKWLNKSVKLSAVYDEIDAKLTGISIDLVILSNLPEFGFEAEEVYKSTLDMNRAISEGKRLAEIQKKKAEKTACPKETIESKASPEEPLHTIALRAYMTVQQMKELKEFFESRNIEFERI